MLYLRHSKSFVQNQAKTAKLQAFQGAYACWKLCVVTTCDREIKIKINEKPQEKKQVFVIKQR